MTMRGSSPPAGLFLFLVATLWKKIIVAHANGMHWKKAYAVMVKANVVQISDIWMTVVNVGRVLKMTKQEAKKMKKELYIIDEKLKNDQMSLKKIVHCDIVSTVEQRS